MHSDIGKKSIGDRSERQKTLIVGCNRGHLLSMSSHPTKFQHSRPSGSQVMNWKRFSMFRHCNLDLLLKDPEISKGRLLCMSNNPIMFQHSGSSGSQVIDWKEFSMFRSL